MKKIISPDDILKFYTKGLFPMADNAKSEIVKLYQPKKRFLIPINSFHIPRKLFKVFKKKNFTFKINSSFENVIYKCQTAQRRDNGTWINEVILNTFINLHNLNMCHSVECFKDKQLVGGLYGLQIGACFFGESMFSDLSNTSKLCLLYLIAILKKNSFSILDSQFYNKHLVQFGAYEVNNYEYLKKIKEGIKNKSKFIFIDDFHEVLSLLQPNNHKS